MSKILESPINNINVKLKRLNKEIIFRDDNNNRKNDDNKGKGKINQIFKKYNLLKDSKVKNDSNSYILQNNLGNNSYNSILLKDFNNSKFDNQIDVPQSNKTLIQNVKYVNLKSLLNYSRKTISNQFYTPKIAIRKPKSTNKSKQINKIKSYLLKNREGHNNSFKNFQRYNDLIKIARINKANSVKNNIYSNEDISILNNSENIKNDFIKNKFGIYLYKNKYINEHYSFLIKGETSKIINDKKKKKPKIDIFNYFNKLKANFLEENKAMRKKIKSSYSALEYKKKLVNEKKDNIYTPKGFRKLFFEFNKQRAKKENILTNLYINPNKNPSKKLYNLGEKIEASKIINENNIANLAINKVNKLYHDLLIFQLPNLDEKIYIRKILYDIFIEFKNMLTLSMMKNKNINIYKKGLDFETFYNCNTKINQQGQILAKRIFKIFNNKSDTKFMPFENYVKGMLKLKNTDKENKLNLFFDLLDENSKGFMTYDDIYKFGIISLQKITLNLETLEDFEKAKKNKDKKMDVEVIENLADYFSRMIFKLVNIDIKENIPLKLLKKMIIQGGEQADYIEFLFGSGNFV